MGDIPASRLELWQGRLDSLLDRLVQQVSLNASKAFESSYKIFSFSRSSSIFKYLLLLSLFCFPFPGLLRAACPLSWKVKTCTKPSADLLDSSCTSKFKKKSSYLTSYAHFCIIFISGVEIVELIRLGYCECQKEITLEKRLERFREDSTHVASKQDRGAVSSLDSPQTFEPLQMPSCFKGQFILSFLLFLFSLDSLLGNFAIFCMMKC